MKYQGRDYPFTVAYEDNHIIVVNKESGVLVQGDKTGDAPLLDHVKAYIGAKYEKPGKVFLGTVHRIDRPVSGLVVFGRTSKGLERMNELLRKKQLYKTYWAVVKNKPKKESGKLKHWIQKDSAKNKVQVFDEETEEAQLAELTYSTLGFLNDHYLLQVSPITGRPHQIRAQLSAIGCPIRGDIKYGFGKPNPDKSINLHARKLHFVHPVKKEPITLVGGVPNDSFWEQYLVLEDLKEKDIDRIIDQDGAF